MRHKLLSVIFMILAAAMAACSNSNVNLLPFLAQGTFAVI